MTNTKPRNSPCKCGSGLKYKKCCLLKELEQRQLLIKEQNRIFKERRDQAAKKMDSVIAALPVISSGAGYCSWLGPVVAAGLLHLNKKRRF